MIVLKSTISVCLLLYLQTINCLCIIIFVTDVSIMTQVTHRWCVCVAEWDAVSGNPVSANKKVI